jgi:choline dehydrogenase
VLVNFLSFVFDTSKPPTGTTAFIYPLHAKPAIGLSTFIARPHSRGKIRLRSNAPGDAPLIYPAVLGDERDVETLVRAGKLLEKIVSSPGLAELIVGRLDPQLTSDDEWRDYVRNTAGIGYHAAGTCRMGGDPDSVVDPMLRVRGVQALRVVDASIMPAPVSANTNAPTMMIGERGSAFILQQGRESTSETDSAALSHASA